LGKTNRLTPLEIEAADEGKGPDEQVDSDQASSNVQAALMTIKSDYRSVVVLKHFLGCSYTEISQVLDIPEKKVKSRLYSARQQLKDALADTN
jgi:RNA polymerase sigma-70 factor (ECF subfamily)